MNSNAEYNLLSVPERIQLVEDIWDSIAQDTEQNLALSDSQITELHRRFNAHQNNPNAALDWEVVRKKLFQH